MGPERASAGADDLVGRARRDVKRLLHFFADFAEQRAHEARAVVDPIEETLEDWSSLKRLLGYGLVEGAMSERERHAIARFDAVLEQAQAKLPKRISVHKAQTLRAWRDIQAAAQEAELSM